MVGPIGRLVSFLPTLTWSTFERPWPKEGPELVGDPWLAMKFKKKKKFVAAKSTKSDQDVDEKEEEVGACDHVVRRHSEQVTMVTWMAWPRNKNRTMFLYKQMVFPRACSFQGVYVVCVSATWIPSKLSFPAVGP